MNITASDTVHVSDSADVILAGRHVRRALAELVTSETTIDDIVLVAHELASNIVKHAAEGTITVGPCSDANRDGVQISAEDSGPGISDVEQAVTDGYSTTGSLGGGLGTVHRLMDDVVVDSDGNEGVQITATRWCTDSAAPTETPPITVGAATRPKPGCDHNGDTFVIKHGESQTLLGVIDGLGHGIRANRASSEARLYVQSNDGQPLSKLFDGVERVCRSTRGVVMALARFDWNTREVSIGSVGNVGVRVRNAPTGVNVVTPRGVLGGNAPSPVIKRFELEPNHSLLLHSDGLATPRNEEPFSHLDSTSATHTAQELLRLLSKGDDDTTVLVAKGRTDE